MLIINKFEAILSEEELNHMASRFKVFCPDCGLALSDAGSNTEQDVVCPGCGCQVTGGDGEVEAMVIVKASRVSAKLPDCSFGETLIPWFVGALGTLILVIVLSKMLSCAFELNAFGVIGACASSFLVLLGGESTARVDRA